MTPLILATLILGSTFLFSPAIGGKKPPPFVYPASSFVNSKYPLNIPSPYTAGGLVSIDPDCANFTASECEMRKEKCKSIGSLASGTSGPVKDVFTCATALSIPKASFVSSIGQAFKEGRPEKIVDIVTNDTALGYHLRRCILMQNGLLGLNDTINRMMLNSKIQSTFGWNPPMAAIVLEAAENCPEGEDLKFTEYLNCVRRGCIQNLSISTFAFTDPKMMKKKGKKGDDDDD